MASATWVVPRATSIPRPDGSSANATESSPRWVGARWASCTARGSARPSATSRYIFQGPGLGNLTAYVGIALLGCVGQNRPPGQRVPPAIHQQEARFSPMACRDRCGSLPEVSGFGLVEGPRLGLVSGVRIHLVACTAGRSDEQNAKREPAHPAHRAANDRVQA